VSCVVEPDRQVGVGIGTSGRSAPTPATEAEEIAEAHAAEKIG
jgi:hypothetical protein